MTDLFYRLFGGGFYILHSCAYIQDGLVGFGVFFWGGGYYVYLFLFGICICICVIISGENYCLFRLFSLFLDYQKQIEFQKQFLFCMAQISQFSKGGEYSGIGISA